MAAWSALESELDRWAETDRAATMWWRDDDATTSTDALVRALVLADSFDVSVALAVVPARFDSTLRPLISQHSRAVVLQHGYAHQNHARAGERKIELGPQRPFMHTLADLATGWQRLETELCPQAIPVLVPPWNRLAPGLAPLLPEVGFQGLSTFGPRQRPRTTERLTRANVHVDIIDWRHGRRFVGLTAAVTQLVSHLQSRRVGDVDSTEPTGIMTHHADHDAECWQFLEALLTRTTRHPAARWLAATDIFSSTDIAGPRDGRQPHG